MQRQIKFLLSSSTRNIRYGSGSGSISTAHTMSYQPHNDTSTRTFSTMKKNHRLINTNSRPDSNNGNTFGRSDIFNTTYPTTNSKAASTATTATTATTLFNHVTGVQIRLKSSSSLHKKAMQALNKNKQIKNQKQKQKHQNNNAGNSTTEASNSNSMTMTVNDDIIKEANKEDSSSSPVLNGMKDGTESLSLNQDGDELKQQPDDTIPTPRMNNTPTIHQGHLHEFAPRIVVVGVGGGGGNAVNNMIANQLSGMFCINLVCARV